MLILFKRKLGKIHLKIEIYSDRYGDRLVYMGMPGWHKGQEDCINCYIVDGRHRGRHVLVRSVFLGILDLPVLQRIRVSIRRIIRLILISIFFKWPFISFFESWRILILKKYYFE